MCLLHLHQHLCCLCSIGSEWVPPHGPNMNCFLIAGPETWNEGTVDGAFQNHELRSVIPTLKLFLSGIYESNYHRQIQRAKRVLGQTHVLKVDKID